MRILDNVSDKKLDEILIFLTKDEASEMAEVLTDYAKGNYDTEEDHYHLTDFNRENGTIREITIAMYDENDSRSWSKYSKRCQKLIEEDI